MAVKDVLIDGLGKLMQSDQVTRVFQNEGVMKAIMKAFTVSTEARQMIDGRLTSMIKTLNLVTRDDLLGIWQSVERLEGELAALHKRADQAIGEAADAAKAAAAAARQADLARVYAERAPGAAKGKAVTAKKSGGARKSGGAKKPAAKKPAATKKAATEKKSTSPKT